MNEAIDGKSPRRALELGSCCTDETTSVYGCISVSSMEGDKNHAAFY